MTYSTLVFSLAFWLNLALDPPSEDATQSAFLGKASYYAKRFEGKRTAFGEIFRNNLYTAAHRTFAHNTLLEVTNLKNGKNVVVRVNDRGPWTKRHFIDISQAAAEKLGIIRSGVGDVSVRVVGKDGKLFEETDEAAPAGEATNDGE